LFRSSRKPVLHVAGVFQTLYPQLPGDPPMAQSAFCTWRRGAFAMISGSSAGSLQACPSSSLAVEWGRDPPGLWAVNRRHFLVGMFHFQRGTIQNSPSLWGDAWLVLRWWLTLAQSREIHRAGGTDTTHRCLGPAEPEPLAWVKSWRVPVNLLLHFHELIVTVVTRLHHILMAVLVKACQIVVFVGRV
jgi:hypothetical protein